MLSCEEVRPGDADSRETGSCYEVMVDFYGMFREAVPESVWKEIKKRETAYYDN